MKLPRLIAYGTTYISYPSHNHHTIGLAYHLLQNHRWSRTNNRRQPFRPFSTDQTPVTHDTILKNQSSDGLE